MKRAFPNQVKAVDARETLNNIMVEPSKQGIGGSGMACKSAAVIGLAIMGASSVLLPGGDDRVLATEPPAADTTANNLQLSSQQALTQSVSEAQDSQTATAPSESQPQQGQVFLRLTQGSSSSAQVARNANPLGSNLQIPAKQEPKIPALPSLSIRSLERSVTLLPGESDYGLSQSDLSPGRPVVPLEANRLSRTVTDVPSRMDSGKLEPSREQGQAEWVSEGSTSWSKSSPQAFKRLSAEDFTDFSAVRNFPVNASASPSVEFSTPANLAPSLDEAQAQESPLGVVVIDPKLSDLSVSVLYTVQPGDTLDRIAEAHGISVETLLAINEIQDRHFLKVNQLLKVPQLPSLPSGEPVVISEQADDLSASVPVEPIISLPSTSESRSELTRPVVPVLHPRRVDATTATEETDSVVSVAPSDSQEMGVHPLESANQSPARWQTHLATRTLEEGRTLQADGAETNTNPYAERLRAEIVRLREEYKAERELYQVPVVNREAQGQSRTNGTVQHLNPEFVGQGFVQNEMSSAQNRALMQRYQQATQAGEVAGVVSTPQVPPPTPQTSPIAVAPFTGSAYDPLNNPALGRMVSPELPPLPAPEAYLPGSNSGTMQFTGYTWPAKGVLTSGYGWRWGRMHRGIDIAGPVGTPIVAAAPGVVTYADWNDGGYGYLVEIEHPNGSLTLYAHNHRILVQKGQKVEQGQQIAEMGSTGFSTGPHLHFEIHPAGQGAVNPMAHLPANSATASR